MWTVAFLGRLTTRRAGNVFSVFHANPDLCVSYYNLRNRCLEEKKATFGDFGRFKCTRRGNRCAVLTETLLNLGALELPRYLRCDQQCKFCSFQTGSTLQKHSETKFRCGVLGIFRYDPGDSKWGPKDQERYWSPGRVILGLITFL